MSITSPTQNEQTLMNEVKDLKQAILEKQPKVQTFEEADTDKNGSISPQEFNLFVEKMHNTDRNRSLGWLLGKIIDVIFLALLLLQSSKI